VFISDAKLFLEASTAATSAKDRINTCIRLLSETEILDNEYYNKCKTALLNSGIDKLIERIEMTRDSLLSMDSNFAQEYATQIDSFYEKISRLDISKLTEEGLNVYNTELSAYSREYNYLMLEMYEKIESSGSISQEEKATLVQLRLIVEQYAIEDEMAKLATDTDEYIELFKKSAEYDRKIIMLLPNLTEEDKKEALEKYENMYSLKLEFFEFNRDVSAKVDELDKMVKDGKGGTTEYYKKENELCQLKIDYLGKDESVLSVEGKTMLENARNQKELNDLYIEKEHLDNNWIPFDSDSLDDEIISLKIKLGMATEAEKEYMEMGWVEKSLHNTRAFLYSAVESCFNAGESLVDSGVMLVAGAASDFGADTKWAEDFVAVDFAGEAYYGMTLAIGVNQQIAYGDAHAVGNFVGDVAATIAINYLSGGTAMLVTLHGLKGMGNASESVLKSGGTFSSAYWYGVFTGSVDAFTAYQLYGGKYGDSYGKLTEAVGKGTIKLLNQIPMAQHLMILFKGVCGSAEWLSKYSAKYFTSKLLGKLVIGSAKAYILELGSVIIDGDYDLNLATKEAFKITFTTVVGDCVITPIVDRAVEKAAGKVAKEKERLEKELKHAQRRLDKRQANLGDEDFGLDDSGVSYTAPKNVKRVEDLQRRINGLQKSIEKTEYNLAHINDILKLPEKILLGDHTAIKKYTSKFFSKLAGPLIDRLEEVIYGN